MAAECITSGASDSYMKIQGFWKGRVAQKGVPLESYKQLCFNESFELGTDIRAVPEFWDCGMIMSSRLKNGRSSIA